MLPKPFIRRDVIDEILRDLEREEAAVVVGPRQAGKTTILRAVQDKVTRRGLPSLYLSLDIEHDRHHFASQEALLRKVRLEVGDRRAYIFIDELQRLPDAALFLKGLLDMGLPYKFLVSGSGNLNMKSRIKESLVGRKREYLVLPLSPMEYLHFVTDYAYTDRLHVFLAAEPESAMRILDDYLARGGYPRVVLEDALKEKGRVMDDIFDSYISRDVSAWIHVEKLYAYRDLVRILADGSGRMIRYGEISNTLGISLPTVKNYFWYMEGTYLLKRLSPFYRNVRSEIIKAPKAYFLDCGMRHYALNTFGRLTREGDVGVAWETMIHGWLLSRMRSANQTLHFRRSRSGAEVDFILVSGRELIPIEVKSSKFARPVIPRGLHSFIREYSPQRAFLINRTLDTTRIYHGCSVAFITPWRFFVRGRDL